MLNNSSVGYYLQNNSGMLRGMSGDPAFVIKIDQPDGMFLGNLSVFISAVLLSCGGFISMVLGSMNKSRCTRIVCPFSECTRQNLPDGAV